ncbi:hypothetical protein VKT23_018089 [Stygiomarasmius scandens]|uniref:Uncharacterized protein n=1 Tax=Marasmiellus scandens TaxID=2682957 RepID=A0ABR1IQE5_9AGAR
MPPHRRQRADTKAAASTKRPRSNASKASAPSQKAPQVKDEPTSELPPQTQERIKDEAAESGEAAPKARKAKPKQASPSKKKKEFAQIWKQWCLQHPWVVDKDYEQQFYSWEMHKSDAMKYYRFEDYEMDTLPYVKFFNKHNENIPGRSYNINDLTRLAYRKHAAMEGIDGALEGKPADAMLQKGKELFDKHIAKLDENYSKKHNKPRLGPRKVQIVPVRKPDRRPRRPFGSWWEGVWERGEFIGWWLVYHFDPYYETSGGEGAGDTDGALPRELRFWPKEEECPLAG